MDHINFDFHTQLAQELDVNYLHLDVMDGHFVPRYGIYPEIVLAMARMTDLKMDLHLMVSNPEFALAQFQNIDNIEYVSIHFNGDHRSLARTFDAIRNQDRKPVLAIDLGTDTSHVAELIKDEFIDGIMFMGIHPGVLKQFSRPEVVISKLKRLKEQCLLNDLFIQCDGGVSFETIPLLKTAGINNFICGSSTLYKDCDFSEPWEKVKKQIVHNKNKLNELLLNDL